MNGDIQLPATSLIKATDDERGLALAVYQDHAGVRLEAGGVEVMLSDTGARALVYALGDARIAAQLWQAQQPDCGVCGAPAGLGCDPGVPGPIQDGRHADG